MSSFGVTSTGFVRKTTQDVVDSLEAGEKANLSTGSSTNVAADSVLGQLNGVVGAAIAEAWEVAAAVYSGQYPNGANDTSLDNVASLTGTTRNAATRSTGTYTATGTPGTILTTGRVISHSVSEDRFRTTADATLVATVAWVALTAYVVGDRVTNSGNVYICTVAGTSAASGGPTGTGDAIIDATVTWRFVGAGTADIDAALESEQFGPVAGPSGALTTIETPVAGWNGGRNLLDVAIGRDLETDADLKLRRLEELSRPGTATVDAIRSDLLDVTGVIDVFVFENVSDTTGPDGEPSHSIECVCRTTTGDTPDATIDQAIADQIFASKPAGIETFGFGTPPQKVTKTVTDSQGTTHTINWTRVDDIDIFIDIAVTIDGDTYPIDGDEQLKTALVAEGNLLSAGDDVIAEKIKAQAFAVTGVLDITSFEIDTVSPPTGTVNIPITNRQVADFDTSRVDVTSSV